MHMIDGVPMEPPEDLNRPAHSPLGASGAERWMNCPGSVTIIGELTEPEDEHDFTKEGSAIHAAGEFCLNTGAETWEVVGQSFEGVEITSVMAMAVQVYVDICRADMATALEFGVEYQISSPVHPSFYGTADFWALFPTLLKIRDLKGGEGIFVDPTDNPQEKYYAYGVIEMLEVKRGDPFPDDFPVELSIVQPRLPCEEGPHRKWDTTVGEIKEWVHDTLVPAMMRAEHDGTLDAGEWCRFCPAKLACPLLTGLFRAAMTYDPRHLNHYSEESLGRSYRYIAPVKFYLKALGEETEKRLMAGKEVAGAKLVRKQANRVWKPEALELVKKRFGDEAFTKPEIKSPPQIEELGPLGKETVKEYAYTPDTGLTVAPSTDRRGIVKVKSAADTFQAALGALDVPVGA